MSNPRTFLIAGSGRSGTTWIADALASCERCFQVFEPFNAEKVPAVPRWGRGCGLPGPYLRPHEPQQEWQTYVASLCRGDVSNIWTRQDWRLVPRSLERIPLAERVAYRLARRRREREEREAQTLVIKEIRANLMLGWLSEQFELPVLYIMRHPCAVVASRLRLGWSDDLGELESQPSLVADFLAPYQDVIGRAETAVERLAIIWCVENLVPLAQGKDRGWCWCNYETCLGDPSRTFSRMREFFGLRESRASDAAMRRHVSSPETVPGRHRRWHGSLSEKEGLAVLRVCKQFGLDFYADRPDPVVCLDEVIGVS